LILHNIGVVTSCFETVETEVKMQEKISALVDGELTGACIDVALELLHQPDHLSRLDTYHQIRHVLRAGESGLALRPDFSANMITVLRNL
jgi:negative regulator of sigma E activity